MFFVAAVVARRPANSSAFYHLETLTSDRGALRRLDFCKIV
jgi:hypothetical protein